MSKLKTSYENAAVPTVNASCQEMKVVEGAGNRSDPKCTWSEAVTVYENIVKQSRRDIQRAVLGNGPHDLSPTHRHLAVAASSWWG